MKSELVVGKRKGEKGNYQFRKFSIIRRSLCGLGSLHNKDNPPIVCVELME